MPDDTTAAPAPSDVGTDAAPLPPADQRTDEIPPPPPAPTPRAAPPLELDAAQDALAELADTPSLEAYTRLRAECAAIGRALR